MTDSQNKSVTHGPGLSDSRFSDFVRIANQTNQFVGEGEYLLLKVGPDGVCLIRVFRTLSEL